MYRSIRNLAVVLLAAGGVAGAARADVALGGNHAENLRLALDELGVPYADYGGDYPPPYAADVLVIGQDGGSPGPDYRAYLDDGGRVVLAGGSNTDEYRDWARLYFNITDTERGWHTDGQWHCTSLHPANAALPADHTFNQNQHTYHMLGFLPTPDTTLLGMNDEGVYVAAIRRYANGGAFNYMALDINWREDAEDQEVFTVPWLRAALGNCRGYPQYGPDGSALGEAVANVGNLNGDGYDEIAWGAPMYDAGAGLVRLLGVGYWTMQGENAGDRFGTAIAGSNGKLVVGAPFNDDRGTDAGKVYIFAGWNEETRQFDTVWTKQGQRPGDQFGRSVAMDVDVNDDGFDDILVGAPYRDRGRRENVGYVYVFSGRDGRMLKKLKGENAGDRFGLALAGLGRVNRGRHEDFIVGAPKNDDGGKNAGKAYVFDGERFRVLWTKRGEDPGDELGRAVAAIRNADDDNRRDFAIGAQKWDRGRKRNTGQVRVYSGDDGSLLWKKNGKRDNDRYGRTLAPAGDVNGDGYHDLLVGVPRYDWRETDTGRVYLLSGRNGRKLDHFNGTGQQGARFGSALASIGDHAGLAERDRIFVIGAPRADEAYVAFSDFYRCNDVAGPERPHGPDGGFRTLDQLEPAGHDLGSSSADALPARHAHAALCAHTLRSLRHVVRQDDHLAVDEDEQADAAANGPVQIDPDANDDEADDESASDPVANLDLNDDGVVNDEDLSTLLASFGECDDCDADLDDDGVVDHRDLEAFVATWRR